MASLFDFKDLKNSPRRSGFDLGNKLCFTEKCGPLTVPYWTEILPGDTVRYGVQHLTRTPPLNTSAFVRIKEYFDWFFVPTRLLWKSFPAMISQMNDNPVQAKSLSENQEPTQDVPYLMLSDLVSLKSSSNNVNNVFSTDGGIGYLNMYGFTRLHLWAKMCSILGYARYDDALAEKYLNAPTTVYNPVWHDMPVNIFPIAAYHKIYNDYYRFEQWEESSPFLWNFDYSTGGQLTFPSLGNSQYWSGFTFFDTHYANWNKDLFMGLLPNQQFGDAALIESTLQGQINGLQTVARNINMESGNYPLRAGVYNGTNFAEIGVNSQGSAATDWTQYQPMLNQKSTSDTYTNSQVQVAGVLEIPPLAITTSAATNSKAYASIIALRQAEALQRWKEIAQAGDQTYRDQIYRHFGVSLPDEMSDLCQFLGGDSSMINISDVINQSLNGESDVPDIKGRAVGTGDYTSERTFKEHGYLMCIYHAKPLLDYDLTGIDSQLTHTNVYDFAIPEFDKIGMQETPSYLMINGQSTYANEAPTRQPITLGYSARYIDYKTRYDRVTGAFRDTLKHWVAPINQDYLLSTPSSALVDLTYSFFKVNPNVLNNIFAITLDSEDPYANSKCASDQLWVNAYFDVKVVRNLDYDGMPY